MFYLKILAVLAAVMVLEGLAPLYWPVLSYADLPLIVAVYFGLMRDPVQAILVGCIAGLVGDVAPGVGSIIGVGGFAKTLIAYLTSLGVARFAIAGPMARLFVLIIASLVNSLLFVGLHTIMDQQPASGVAAAELVRIVTIESVANLVAGGMLFWAMDRLFRDAVGPEEMRVKRRFYA